MALQMQLRNMNCTFKDVYSLQKFEPTVVIRVDMEKRDMEIKFC